MNNPPGSCLRSSWVSGRLMVIDVQNFVPTLVQVLAAVR